MEWLGAIKYAAELLSLCLIPEISRLVCELAENTLCDIQGVVVESIHIPESLVAVRSWDICESETGSFVYYVLSSASIYRFLAPNWIRVEHAPFLHSPWIVRVHSGSIFVLCGFS